MPELLFDILAFLGTLAGIVFVLAVLFADPSEDDNL